MITNEEREFFIRSKLAKDVLKQLAEGEKIASFLSKDMKKHRESIIRIFLKFEKLKLAECTKPNSSNFRTYKITKKGREILKSL